MAEHIADPLSYGIYIVDRFVAYAKAKGSPIVDIQSYTLQISKKGRESQITQTQVTHCLNPDVTDGRRA